MRIIIDGDPTPRERAPFGVFTIYGGAIGGRDTVHATVTSWRGWRRLPGNKVHPELGSCSVFQAPAYATSVEDVMESLALQVTWTPTARLMAQTRWESRHESDRMLKAEHPVRFPTPGERPPMVHQLQAINAIEAMGYRALLADDMGLGKTATACWTLHRSQATRAVILCPVAVKRNWAREIEVNLGGEWRTVVIGGSRTQRANAFARLHNYYLSGELTSVIINYDLLIHLTEEQAAQLELFVRQQFLICDESHNIKGRKSQRTQATRATFDSAGYVLMLSGTPVRNTVDDLYAQIDLIRPGTWTTHSDFAKRHLNTSVVAFGKKKREVIHGGKNLDELNAVVNSLQVRRKKEDVVDLPPKIRTAVELELDDVTRRLYTAMKKWAILKLAELDDDMNVFDVRAKSAVEAAMRCEQIAQGFCGGIPEGFDVPDNVLKHAQRIPGRPNELLFPDSPKIAWTLETIGTLLAQGCKPIVFSRFNAPLVWLAAQLQEMDVRVSWLHGALSANQKDEQIVRFQMGETEVFLCQVRMAEGFNLVQSQDVLFHGRDWSPAANSQAEDRSHRLGQRGTVNIQIPIVMDTIEVAYDRRLQVKAEEAEAAMRSFTIAEMRDAL